VTFAPTIREVAQYFHAVDLLLYPAWLEEYGRAVLEGLACGTPALVSTAVGAAEVMTAEGVPELIEGWDEATGPSGRWMYCGIRVAWKRCAQPACSWPKTTAANGDWSLCAYCWRSLVNPVGEARRVIPAD
jgi:UDP-glucose:(heptosyl)LPS alpha-1,3-glucosyltransferase